MDIDQTTKPQQLKIALTFSGGGYRAACFALGTLAYLNKLTLNGQSLLQSAVALSTVSGGTITGAAYCIGVKQHKDFTSIYESLCHFMNKTDLVNLALDRLISNDNWPPSRVKSLVNACADVYDAHLFASAKFGELMNEENPIHLRHISFNATEFSNALQFRFQWSDRIEKLEPGEPPRGYIGNNDFRISEAAAAEIRMADILAASSCFPGGFEPINFPSDFVHSHAPNLLALLSQPGYPVGLMDGGIVDNQGIEPILLAESRMVRNRTDPTKTDNELDLIIISDVASPYMEDYTASKQGPLARWRKLTPRAILIWNSVILVSAVSGVVTFLKMGMPLGAVVSSGIASICLVVYGIGKFLKNLPLKLDVPPRLLKPLGKLLRLKLQIYETILVNRKNSMLKMVNEVFLKHIRRLNYAKVYTDKKWQNRRIMNAVYELRSGEPGLAKKINDNSLPQHLVPSPTLQDVATQAASMGTTLWFTESEKKTNMMESIIATGQFTICWNLLEYIGNLKKDKTNTGPQHTLLFNVEEELKKDWENFNRDPFWMVNARKEKTKK